MDFTNRDNRPAAPVSSAPAPASKRSSSSLDNGKWGRIGIVAALSLIVLLLIALTVMAASTNNDKNQGKYVDSSKLQAVFLNTGQVYFGNITSVAKDSMVLTNIYYLQTAGSGTAAQSSNNSNVTLVKLGCELHEPYDKMIINPAQITFWENLQDGGQVATAVKKFEQQNPQGQKCADQSSSSSTNSGNAVQSAGSNNSSNSSNSNTNSNSTNTNNNSSNTTR